MARRGMKWVGWTVLPLLAAMGCGNGFVPTADDGSGGAPAAGGSVDGSASGGGPSDGGDDGDGMSTGGHMATDAPESVGGSASSGGAAGAGNTSGGGGTEPGTGPCYDEPCQGACVGSCEDGFTCDENASIGCAAVITTVCGCDGKNFTLPSACPSKGYAHTGACEPPAEGHNCALADIVCLPIVAPEPCPGGLTYSVVSGCYGDCVPVEQCACDAPEDCPEPGGSDHYTCHNDTDRCGPYVN